MKQKTIDACVNANEHNFLTSQSCGLGRLVSLDPRDLRFLATPPQMDAITDTDKFYRTGPVLDQKDTPQCVGYSSKQFLVTAPVKNRSVGLAPQNIYDGAQQLDEIPDDEPYEGTTVRGAMKYLKSLGYLTKYQWALDADTVARWMLSGRGPVVVGTTWYSDMFSPSDYFTSVKDGAARHKFVRATGSAVGGHAYLLDGVDTKMKCPDKTRGAFRICNSWGKSWGDGGKVFVSIADMDKLIKDWGEAAMADEILLP